MTCRHCRTGLKKFFSLGRMPLVNSFPDRLPEGDKRYDLSLGFCQKCSLVQLLTTVDPKMLFSDYVYFSGTSSAFTEHCRVTAEYLSNRFSLDKNSLVMEIASNDGTQLSFFQKKGIPVLGVDPAKNIAAAANKAGIPTDPEFFNSTYAKKYLKMGKKQPDLIFGANVLAHVPRIVDFVRGLKTVLKGNGTAIFEFPYLAGLLEGKFDTIYHEHVFYYSLTAVSNIFLTAGLAVYDAEKTPVQGGSLRIYAAKPGIYPETDRLKKIITDEKKSGFGKISTYLLMSSKINEQKRKLIKTLNDIKKKHLTIAAYAAPAKGVILINYFGLEKYLDFIVDKAVHKQHRFVPGTALKVGSPDLIKIKKPDYVLILAWNIAGEVIGELKNKFRYRGKFIIPVPRVKIIGRL